MHSSTVKLRFAFTCYLRESGHCCYLSVWEQWRRTTRTNPLFVSYPVGMI